MKAVSTFAGIGGFDLGFSRAGFDVIAHAENEPNCCQLLSEKFPHAAALHDVRALIAVMRRIRLGQPVVNYESWKARIELLRTADVWTAGFPCQDLSVAGARAGLAGERSGLWFAFRRIAALFRPPWLVLENVPGLLSSQEGRDLATLLSGLGQLGYWWAYRTLDAQYFGLAQRRQRVVIVASLGTLRCAQVLFESESVCGDSAPSREEGQRVAPTVEGRAGRSGANNFATSGGLAEVPVCANPIGAHHRRDDLDHDTYIPVVAKALNAERDGYNDGSDQTYIPDVAWALQERDSKGSDSSTKERHLLAIPIQGVNGSGKAQNGIGIGEPGDEMFTLTSRDHHAIAFSCKNHGQDAGEDLSPTLRAMEHDESHSNGGGQVAIAYRTSGNCGVMEQGDKTAALNCATDPTQQIILTPQTHPDYASPQKTHTVTTLRLLRDTIGEEAFAEWGLGILIPFYPAEVLRSGLHGSRLRPAAFPDCWMVCVTSPRPTDSAKGFLLTLRATACAGRTSQGQEFPQQLAVELGAYLSKLSQPGTQKAEVLHHLWLASQGFGILRQALSAIQEVWQSVVGQSQSTQATRGVRRLNCEECEFLQGFPRGWTCAFSDSVRYKQLGNAFPPPIAEWVAKRILKAKG